VKVCRRTKQGAGLSLRLNQGQEGKESEGGPKKRAIKLTRARKRDHQKRNWQRGKRGSHEKFKDDQERLGRKKRENRLQTRAAKDYESCHLFFKRLVRGKKNAGLVNNGEHSGEKRKRQGLCGRARKLPKKKNPQLAITKKKNALKEEERNLQKN